MENNKPLLSLCIPTNGRVDWIMPLIDSVYSQNVDDSLFEVVITDNGEDDILRKEISKISHSNLRYYKTQSKGFTNQIDAFENCSGLFCKMLNHRSLLLPDSIEQLITLVEQYKYEKPIIYCTDGRIKGDVLIECSSIDEFVKIMGVRSSWSAGTGAWKEDVRDMKNKFIDPTFPHTVFLFELRSESKYVIWNKEYHSMQDESGKGGYDVIKAFSVIYLDILSRLRYQGRISIDTFLSTKKELYYFSCALYHYHKVLPSKNSFIIQDVRNTISVYYGKYYYIKLLCLSYTRIPLSLIQFVGRKLKNFFVK